MQEIEILAGQIRGEVGKVIVGQDKALDLMLIAMLCDGHLLLEGPPGTAKTMLAHAFAATLSLDYGRIQFTPDLMPGDIVGTNLFNFQTNEFKLTKGPIFTQILLGDEINRTPPKTQAALLEAMQERAVTIDGTTYPLDGGFMVIATQNPIEQQGTYPLPEAQLDRFLFKHVIDYPGREEEIAIVTRHGSSSTNPDISSFGVTPVVGQAGLAAASEAVSRVRIGDEVVAYIVELVRATREHPSIEVGASPRAAVMIAAAARAHAVLRGRDFVIPDDVKAIAVPALQHRILLAPGAEIEGQSTAAIINQILEQVAAPR